MKLSSTGRVMTVACLAGICGCVPGYNSLLFYTKTNVGLIVETQPPEVALDIGRQEGLLAPSYEAGKTPPVMASFRFDSQGFFSNYIGSAFATGDAAVAMARLYDAPDWPEAKGEKAWDLTGEEWRSKERDFDSAIALHKAPQMPWFVPKEKPGAVRQVLFGTDTSFGFKVAWKNPESPVPDFLRLAYQRRELAFAAVTIGLARDKDGELLKDKNGKLTNQLEANVPSLLATVDTAVELREPWKSKFEYLQYFASGRAATALAFRHAVRKAMLTRLDPEQEKRLREAGSVIFNAGVDAEAPRAHIQSWIDDETPVVVLELRETSERLTREAQDAAQVSAQAVEEAKNAQRMAEEVQEAAVSARAEADRLCQESEAADREGSQNALENAQGELASAEGGAEAAQEAIREAGTADERTRALEEAQASVIAAEQNVGNSQQALDDAIAKARACQQAQQLAEELEEKADDTEMLASARHRFTEKALQDSTAAGLKAEKIKKRADAATRAAQGLDTSEEGIINMWLLDDWVTARGYGIDFNQWLYSVSANELAIGIRELEIP